MLYVVSNKIYSLEKRHGSDSLALRVRRALKACKQGDGIICKNIVEINTIKRHSYRQKVPVAVRKQERGYWIVYPIFYRNPNLRDACIEQYKKAQEKLKNEQQKRNREET